MDDQTDSPIRRRAGGRPQKYDWLDKRDICHKLYVDEHRSIDEISKYFAQIFNADPSEIPCRRSFLRQFRAWGFPTRGNRLDPEEEEAATARIKELWEQNVSQKDIKAQLNEEGFELRDYDFAKLWRKKLKLRLRNDKGFKEPEGPLKSKKRTRSASAQDGDGESATPEMGFEAAAGAQFMDQTMTTPIAPPLDHDAAARRAQRLAEIQAESDQRMSERKRRRRIRGYGHMGPDAPGTEPRYNSETSLDECKAILHLSNEMYAAVRRDFEVICREQNIIKKTLCADGVWEASKDRLIRENMHLTAMTHQLQPDLPKKAIALDCVCTDVTKRMRVAGNSITIAEANNMIGLNPTESKAVRRSLYEILAAEGFESKLVSGHERWEELRDQWHRTNMKLLHAVQQGDPKLQKAVDLLCSDAMKRFREDKNKRGERAMVQKNAKYGPGPGPNWNGTTARTKQGARDKSVTADVVQSASVPDVRPPRVRNTVIAGSDYPPQNNLLADLANTAGSLSFDLDPALGLPGQFAPLADIGPPSGPPIPAYFRLAPDSRLIGNHPKMWLGKLASPTIASLHVAATCKTRAALVSRVHGVVKDPDGMENSYLIESQDELEAYLAETGEKASFTVMLEGGYA